MSSASPSSLPSTVESSDVRTSSESHPTSRSHVHIRQNRQPQPELSNVQESVLATPQHHILMPDDEEGLFSDSQFDPEAFFNHVDSLLDDNTGATSTSFIDLIGDPEQSTSSHVRSMESRDKVILRTIVFSKTTVHHWQRIKKK